MAERPKCVKCSGPGNRSVYRQQLPPDIPESRCEPHGILWRVPCCARHYQSLSRCATRGCSMTATRRGLCNACDMRARRDNLRRNVRHCLRCGVDLNFANYKACGLCAPCHRKALLDGGTKGYAAQLRVLNAGVGANIKAACRQFGASEVARRLRVSVADVMGWARGKPPAPDDVLAAVVAMLEGE